MRCLEKMASRRVKKVYTRCALKFHEPQRGFFEIPKYAEGTVCDRHTKQESECIKRNEEKVGRMLVVKLDGGRRVLPVTVLMSERTYAEARKKKLAALGKKRKRAAGQS